MIRYNQEPHLSQDTKWESNKITINITNNSKEVSTFPLGDHKTISLVDIPPEHHLHQQGTAVTRGHKSRFMVP